jgi:hypothetical protein
MSGYVLISGFMLCLSCFILHVILWRLRRPVNDIRILLCIFLFFPAALFLALYIVSPPWFPLADACLAFILHFCLASAYIASYPAAQAHSPSLDIILEISRSSHGKMSESELVAVWESRNLVSDRIDDLRIGGLIAKQGDIYTLNMFGQFVLAMYRLYRRFLGIPFGQG